MFTHARNEGNEFRTESVRRPCEHVKGCERAAESNVLNLYACAAVVTKQVI